MNLFAAMTWPEVERRSGVGVLLIPVGSTEQHGPHLPLTTDTDIAVALARGAAARDEGLVVAPPLAYGSSGEHQAFAGTISIGQEATELVLLELGRSASLAFGHTIVVSAHGGNAGPVARATERLAGEGRSVVAWMPPWNGDLHAGRTETSVMLAFASDRVHLEQAQVGDTRPLAELYPLMRRDGVRAVSPNGVLGDPAGACAEEGRLLLDDAVNDLIGRAQRLRHTPTMEVTR
jgi:mycofactocin system creatininase family protein